MTQPTPKNVWEGDKMLNIYIYDYCLKRNWNSAAQAFLNDAQVARDSQVPIDSPNGFLYEWWAVFWDIFSAKTNKSGSKDAQAFVEAQNIKNQSRQLTQQQQMQKMMSQSSQQLGQSIMSSGPAQQLSSPQPNSPVINTTSGANQHPPNLSAGFNGQAVFSPPQANAQLPGNQMNIGDPSTQAQNQTSQMQAAGGPPGMRPAATNQAILQQIMQGLGFAGRDINSLSPNEKQMILAFMKKPQIMQQQIAAQMQRPGGAMPGMGGMAPGQMALQQQQQGGQPGMMSPPTMNAALAASMNASASPPDPKRPRPNSMGPTSIAGFSPVMGQSASPTTNGPPNVGPNMNMAQFIANNPGQNPNQAQLLGKGWPQNLSPQQLQILQRNMYMQQQQQSNMMMGGQAMQQGSAAGNMSPQNVAMLGANMGNINQMMMQQHQFIRMQQQKMQQAQNQQLLQQQQQQQQKQQQQQQQQQPQPQQNQVRPPQQPPQRSPQTQLQGPQGANQNKPGNLPNARGPNTTADGQANGGNQAQPANPPPGGASMASTPGAAATPPNSGGSPVKSAAAKSPKLFKPQKSVTPSPKAPHKPTPAAQPPLKEGQSKSAQSSPQLPNTEAHKVEPQAASMPNTPATTAANPPASSAPPSSNDPNAPSNPIDIDQFIMDEDLTSFFSNMDNENLGLGDDLDVDSFSNMDFLSNMNFMGDKESQ
ncbi:hypothetical protein K493DRAFT_319695 [Basidiobolus meristosporus CBS 931.73]|uniref:Uncharacterized protein n=1 Tax=Basidiobolus meristosporus CBS 931.73 TaxID=1314790 RepID=A0A1Y1XP16_9FUNG|nr:hypothetical protein K493DRAFT_319695 [Basidiobolus meristosporus CBS 931.73]|eukprot:ORX87266.1 hypothetical protein K493DRAFT_319695 [Basidiobolus meristosporus CBS 931.73]